MWNDILKIVPRKEKVRRKGMIPILPKWLKTQLHLSALLPAFLKWEWRNTCSTHVNVYYKNGIEILLLDLRVGIAGPIVQIKQLKNEDVRWSAAKVLQPKSVEREQKPKSVWSRHPLGNHSKGLANIASLETKLIHFGKISSSHIVFIGSQRKPSNSNVLS